MDLMTLLVELVSGAVGGNVSGALNKAKSMGPTLNSVVGAIGGVIFGQGLSAAGVLENLGMGGDAIGSAVGGLVVTLIAGFFKKSG